MNKEQIYEEFHNKVLYYIQSQVNDHYLAEDICSDVFLKIYEKIDLYNNKKSSLSTWIFTITRNTLIDYYRSRKITQEIDENYMYEEDVSDINEEMLEDLAKGLEKLDEKSKKIIVWHYYEGRKLKDIALDLNISYVYVKLLHKKSLLLLKKYLND